jgi:hypothetical protein
MTVDLKYSWFQAQKNTKRAKNVRKRYNRKVDSLESIFYNSERFGITLPEDTRNEIHNKKTFYYRQMIKLSHFIRVLEQKDMDSALKNLHQFYKKEELEKVNPHKTEMGILKVIRKLKKMF